MALTHRLRRNTLNPEDKENPLFLHRTATLEAVDTSGRINLFGSQKPWAPEKANVPSRMARPGYLSAVQVDNSDNDEATYLKLYDSIDPTFGTTEPVVVLKIPAQSNVLTPLLLPTGLHFSEGLSLACAKEGGGDCTTNPDEDVTVTLFSPQRMTLT